MATSVDISSGIVNGLKNVQDYSRDRPERDARRAQAQLIQKRSEAQVTANLPQQQANVELETLKQQLKTMQANSLKAETYSSFDRFNSDGDFNHLNTFLTNAKQNPIGSQLYSNMVRFDPISDTPEVRAQLGQMGVDNVADYIANPELARSKALATQADGTQKVIDMNKVYGMTGYTDYLGAKKLEALNSRVAIDRLLQGPQSAETNMIRQIAEEQGISLTKAAQEFYTSKRSGTTGGRTSAQERIADEIQTENPEMSREDAMIRAKQLTTSGSALEREARRISSETGENFQSTYTSLKNNEERTTKRKQLDEAEQVRSKIDEATGGNFLELEKVDDNTRRKVGRYITELESLTGSKFTTDDKKELRKLRNLMQLGGKAGEKLTDADTGFIDATLKSVKKYFVDDATGTEASSAYQTFANSLRNMFYGATLTDAEIEAFRLASGSLKQQLKPALAGLKTQLSTVQDQMKSIYDLNDEYVAQYYLGTSLGKMEEVMNAMDERIDLFDELEQSQNIKATVPIQGKTNESSEIPARPSLNEIFGRAK